MQDAPFGLRSFFNWLLLFVVLLLPASCHQTPGHPLFSELPAQQTGIHFANRLPEQTPDGMNIVQYLYYYNGGGIAAGDVNNDGLPDLFFTANVETNRLYLNKGNFQFDDVTEKAGVGGTGSWKTGATMADVNADGWLDIYVCQVGNYKSFKGKNQLFINNRDGTFTDRAAEYGLDLAAFCTQAVFFDYDRDNDLDCFVLCHSVHSPDSYKDTSVSRQFDALASDRLFRNEMNAGNPSLDNPTPGPSPKGEGSRRVDDAISSPLPLGGGAGGGVSEGGVSFTDITPQSGLRDGKSGYGLGVTVGDVNGDGYPDIYVANDFHENDYLYYNIKGRYFSEGLGQSMGHTSNFSMGCDMADVNNDGRPDIVSLDMQPEDEVTLKSSQPADPYAVYDFKHSYGYYWQIPQNCLQLNRGAAGRPYSFQEGYAFPDPKRYPEGWKTGFSEIARFAGVAATDWSWSALLADFDLDGWKDLFITNGIPHRPNDMDYIRFTASADVQRQAGDLEFVKNMPPGAAENYCFRNTADLRFENVSHNWGLAHKGCSNGAAYADLDNDGDLDLVTNNLNEPASVFRNNSTGLNFLKIKLTGPPGNPFGVGARVEISDSLGFRQMLELQPVRGFQSSSEPVLVFGLGSRGSISAVRITWPDGAEQQEIRRMAANQTLNIRQGGGAWLHRDQLPFVNTPRFTGAMTDVRHETGPVDDITTEKLLPWSLATQGPKLAVGDVNGDGAADFYLPNRTSGQLVLQTGQGFSTPKTLLTDQVDRTETCAVFFDANGDGAPDLYIGTGGNRLHDTAPALLDVLLLNDGRGNFHPASDNALPTMYGNTACVRPADFDGDGDLDLFVGGRSVTGAYGLTPHSYLLLNDGRGHFTEATGQASGLATVGMVTDAQWTDVNADGRPDLAVCGEWMPLTIFENTGAGFKKTEIPHSAGLWNCLTVADPDGDGDPDLLAGNFGLNSILRASPDEPLGLWVRDIDSNGSVDPILSYFRQGKNRVFADKDWLISQLPGVKKQFVQYRKYAECTFEQVFPAATWQGALHRGVEILESCWVENQSNGAWRLHPLPAVAQFSPVFAMLPGDFDADGRLDLLLGGNLYEIQPAIGRQDANSGTFLKGDGRGGFSEVPGVESGFRLQGAVRDLQEIRGGDGKRRVLVGVNGGAVQVFGQ